jgi:hypothetical protein
MPIPALDVVSPNRDAADRAADSATGRRFGVPVDVLRNMIRIWGPPMEDLEIRARGATALGRLEAIRLLRTALDEAERATVAGAGHHVTYPQIGAALGLSKTAAHRRFHEVRP